MFGISMLFVGFPRLEFFHQFRLLRDDPVQVLGVEAVEDALILGIRTVRVLPQVSPHIVESAGPATVEP